MKFSMSLAETHKMAERFLYSSTAFLLFANICVVGAANLFCRNVLRCLDEAFELRQVPNIL